MSPHTRQAIKSYLDGFIEGVIDAFVTQDLDPRELRPPRTVSVHGDLKPFHEAVLPHGILSITAFERSCSSRLGTTFEESARLMGAETFHPLSCAGRGVLDHDALCKAKVGSTSLYRTVRFGHLTSSRQGRAAPSIPTRVTGLTPATWSSCGTSPITCHPSSAKSSLDRALPTFYGRGCAGANSYDPWPWRFLWPTTCR